MNNHPENKFKVGDWITPNPNFIPSGGRSGRLLMGKGYMVLNVSTSPHTYQVRCEDGSVGRWIEECWIAGKPSEPVMPDLEMSLDEIHQAQEVFNNG